MCVHLTHEFNDLEDIEVQLPLTRKCIICGKNLVLKRGVVSEYYAHNIFKEFDECIKMQLEKINLMEELKDE